MFIFILLGIQCVQGVRVPLSGFSKSYWLINYDHGFVRRGLAGEVVESLSGLGYETAIKIASWSVSILALVAVLWVIEKLVQHRTAASAMLAVIIAASPFTVDQIVFQRRPDVLGLALLILTGAAALGDSRRYAIPVIGVAFGLLCFVHEAVALLYVPSAVALMVIVAHRRGRNASIRDTLCVALPPGAAVVACVVFGRASTAQIAEMKISAPIPFESKLFDYLNDNALNSARAVMGMSHGLQAVSLTVGLALCVLHVRWIAVTGLDPWAGSRGAKPSWLRNMAALAFMIGIALVFSTGKDWVRWFCIFGTTYMVLASFGAIAQNRSQTTRERISIPGWLVPTALYLALIPPLREILSASTAIKSFLLFG